MSQATAEPRVRPPLVTTGRQRRWLHGDQLFRGLAVASGVLLLLVSAIFLLALFIPALPSITRFGLPFLWGRDWDAVHLRFGALPFIYGTVVTSAIGMLIAFPVGLGAALFLAEESRLNWIRAPLSFAVELLAGIPSVVIGLWALFILTPIMRDDVEPFLNHLFGFLPFFQPPFSGTSFLTAGIVLAIMVLPILIALSRDVIRAVPRSLQEASLALGATRAETTWSVVLPYARVGITGAVLLALGRALGETIAVTMVIGNTPQITSRLFAQGYTLASVIANEFTEAVGPILQGVLFEIGLVLVLITIVVNVIARLMVWQFTKPEGR
ncbi:MAG TPA: phosphate ABC transporter permease subunit PstC [Candidatus Limnocylindrales bacterium]|nr:phosphate ABC transporter permease subunit PstC [Candidatus Limnocylindrales bacterium]